MQVTIQKIQQTQQTQQIQVIQQIQQTQQIQAKTVEKTAQKIHTKTNNSLKNILAISL